MTVHFSTRCPNSDYLGFEASPEAIVAAAKKAEEVGFDAVFVNDHIIVGADARSEPWTNVYDPLVAMSFVAAHTSHIRVGVSVLIMPYRNPIATAKALATIDLMSGGRLTVGVGVGWNEAEFAALGVPFHERGARTNGGGIGIGIGPPPSAYNPCPTYGWPVYPYPCAYRYYGHAYPYHHSSRRYRRYSHAAKPQAAPTATQAPATTTP